jgi:Asp-tRNA(Asn)/Glu-tRNA(Gln) amidotransferase A subunit family amidase
VVNAPLPFRPRSRLDGLRLGVLAEELQQHALDAAALERLRELGATLVPVRLPDMDPVPLALVLAVEAATVFDTFTRERLTDQMLRQERNAWPNVFRAARLVPAVEYLRAQRLRQDLLAGVEAMAITVDAWLAPATRGDNLLVTNLSGHPCIALPAGFDEDGMPHGITVCARLYDEAAMLAVAEAYQGATDWHLRRPPGFGPR